MLKEMPQSRDVLGATAADKSHACYAWTNVPGLSRWARHGAEKKIRHVMCSDKNDLELSQNSFSFADDTCSLRLAHDSKFFRNLIPKL